MTGHFSCAEHSHHQTDRTESPGLEQHLQTDRHAKTKNANDGSDPPRLPPRCEMWPQCRPGERQEGNRHQPSAHERLECIFFFKQKTAYEMTVDENPVQA